MFCSLDSFYVQRGWYIMTKKKLHEKNANKKNFTKCFSIEDMW